MEVISDIVSAYASRFTKAEDAYLQTVSAETLANHPHAHMLSGHLQGKFLEILSCALRPQYILEIGTFTGYSALCLAGGLKSGGELHTIEVRSEEAAIARNNFAANERGHQIILHEGNALDILPHLEKEWDLVFIDADKPKYIEYFKLVFPKVRKGGLILADNVLFHGQVLTDQITGRNAKSIQAFNEFIQAESAVQNVLLTIRDGLMLILKK